MTHAPDPDRPVVGPRRPRALANTSSCPPPQPHPSPLPGRDAPPDGPPALLPWQESARAAATFLSAYGATTAASYATDLRDLFAWAHQHASAPLQLTRADLDLYVRHLLDDRRLAVATVRRRLAVVHQYYVRAVEDGVLRDNPASRMRRPRAQSAPPKVRLSTADMTALLRAADEHSPRVALLMHLLLLHGCRIGAVLGANVEDLQGAPGAHRLVLTTKGGDVHELPLSAGTSLLAAQMVAGRTRGPLLLSRTGRRWHRTNAARLLRTLAQQVLDPSVATRLHPHAARRAFVDASLTAGVTLPELQYALGHRSPGMVLHYAAQHEHGRHPVAWRVAALLDTAPPGAHNAGLSP